MSGGTLHSVAFLDVAVIGFRPAIEMTHVGSKEKETQEQVCTGHHK